MLKHLVSRSNRIAVPSLFFSRSFSSKLFVKGISFSSTEETLAKAFSQYGQVLEVTIIMDKVRLRPKGYAYVTFSSTEEADKALLELNGKLVDGRVVFLDTVKQENASTPTASEPTKPAGENS